MVVLVCFTTALFLRVGGGGGGGGVAFTGEITASRWMIQYSHRDVVCPAMD